jgi:hypothetical protein
VQWAALGLGVVIAVASFAVYLVNRAKYSAPAAPPTPQVNPGLLQRDIDRRLPDQATPGMIGVLDDGRVGANDLLITLIDLAARGYLTISPAAGPGEHWLLVRTGKDTTGLRGFETALIDAPFAGTTTTRTLDSLLADDSVVEAAITALQHDADETGWFTRTSDSHWGKIGGALVLAGLTMLATGIIIGLNTLPAPGIAGGALVTGSGLLIATLAKMQRDHSETGYAARGQLARYRDWLEGLSAHQLLPENASVIFNGCVAAALAFGASERFATVYARAYARASGWGTVDTLPVDFDWMQGASSPAHAVHESSRFVADGLALARRYGVE